MHECASLLFPVEFCQPLLAEGDDTIRRGVNSPVLAQMSVLAGTTLKALLTNEHLS